MMIWGAIYFFFIYGMFFVLTEMIGFDVLGRLSILYGH